MGRFMLMNQPPVIAGPSDPYWSSVVWLPDFDGVDQATTAPDDSSYGRTNTFYNTAQLDTSQKPFGGASLLVDRAQDDVVKGAYSSDIQIGSGQFTAEIWIRPETVSGTRTFFGQYDTNSQRSWVLLTFGPALQLITSSDGSATATTLSASSVMTALVWQHVAIDRDASNVLRLYLDGTMVDSTTFASSFFASTADLSVGGLLASGVPAGGTSDYSGHIHEPRLTIGVARYGSDGGFTVPTEAYPRS